MRVHLKFKSLQYALMATELLYDLHPVILKDMLDMKRALGSILGQIIQPNQITYEQREPLTKLIQSIYMEVYLEIEDVKYKGAIGASGTGFNLTSDGNYDMTSKKRAMVAKGTDTNYVVIKQQLYTKLSLSGGLMTGNLDMNSDRIYNVA